LKDAAVLLQQERYAGAIYLAGYAVECLLKWAVTEKRECVYLPAELEIHELDRLLAEAGLKAFLSQKERLRVLFLGPAENWGPELRYLAKSPRAGRATSLYDQMVEVYDWIAEQTI
jgi:hypothetical protein